MSEQKPMDAGTVQNPPREEVDRRYRRRAEWRGGQMRGLFWGMLLILLGILFFVQSQGGISDDAWWQYFLVGLGAIFILDALIHHLKKIPYGVYGRLIAGAVLIVAGLAFLRGWDNWWPLVLIAAGVAILAGYFVRGSK